jgi:hypothetical protein
VRNFLAAAEDQVLAEPQLARHALQVHLVHQLRAELRELPLGHRRKTAVQLVRHRELQHSVAQKLQPLIVRQPLPFLVAERRVRQRLPQQVAIGKRVAEAPLKFFQVRTHAWPAQL